MINNRIQLAKHFRDLGFKVGAEIGVADGRYSEILCQTIPGLKLYCVDPIERKGHYEKATERLSKYNARIIRKKSMDAIPVFDDDFFDFVFIDANHRFDFVMEDIIGWTRKVRKGGIISGHDYYHFNESGVVQAVNTYTQHHKIELNIIPRATKVHHDDRVPCWYFVKP